MIQAAWESATRAPERSLPVWLRRPPLLVRCAGCGRRLEASGFLPACCPDALVSSEYPQELTVDGDRAGLWRFHRWLPVGRPGSDLVGTASYRSHRLAAALGLDELWISVGGYWPERGAHCPTASFKDLEAAVTLRRLAEVGARGVVVASAGNTGRAFLAAGAGQALPVVVIVAERHLPALWRPGAPAASPVLVFAVRDADYTDAGRIARAVAERAGLEVEGGARSVARRDGIGTLLLEAVTRIGRLPDHYVQAVGGGAGPIAVAEAARRLIGAGLAPRRLPTFHLAQNAAHAPVVRAWRQGRLRLPAAPSGVQRAAYAEVLVNRAPAWAEAGGLLDVLRATRGRTYAVRAAAARAAARSFESLEGIDVHPAAAVAVAALGEAVAAGAVSRGEPVLLALTGAGQRRLAGTGPLFPARPALVAPLRGAVEEITRFLYAAESVSA